MPVPVELWIPDQDWLESTEMTVGQSECPEAADVSELNRKDKEVLWLMYTFIQYLLFYQLIICLLFTQIH